MVYVPINTDAYTAAYSGAIAGMAVGGWITSGSTANYALVASIAGAFAQEFDVVWNNATVLTTLESKAITSVVQNEFANRQPGPLERTAFTVPAAWQVPATACAALVLEADAYFASQGITPGNVGGANGFSFRLVDFPSSEGANNNNWQDVVPSAAQFGAVVGTDFTLDDQTGEVTYIRSPRVFLATAACSIYRGDPLEAVAAISLNGDVVLGGTTQYDHEAVCRTDSPVGGKSYVNPQRPLALVTGDKVKIGLRNADTSGTHGVQLHTMVFSFIPID